MTPCLTRRAASAALLSLVMISSAPTVQAADKALRVGIPVWVGFGPWWVAKEKGLFKKHGVNVELRNFAVQSDAVAALSGGSLDAASLATNDVLTINGTKPTASVVMLHDESAGADMLITRGIDTPQALKGQRIALEVGGVSHLFLIKLLEKYGMGEKDVKIVNMAAADAGAAFTAKSINAAVTWEPFGSQGVKSGGKMLLTSKDTPGAIVDVLTVRNNVLKARPEDAKRLVAVWFDALDYVQKNQAEAFKIMAKASDVSVPEFTEMWKGVRFPSLAENREALGSKAGTGTYLGTVGDMGKFMVAQKLITKAVAPASMVTGDFLPAK